MYTFYFSLCAVCFSFYESTVSAVLYQLVSSFINWLYNIVREIDHFSQTVWQAFHLFTTTTWPIWEKNGQYGKTKPIWDSAQYDCPQPNTKANMNTVN